MGSQLPPRVGSRRARLVERCLPRSAPAADQRRPCWRSNPTRGSPASTACLRRGAGRGSRGARLQTGAGRWLAALGGLLRAGSAGVRQGSLCRRALSVRGCSTPGRPETCRPAGFAAPRARLSGASSAGCQLEASPAGAGRARAAPAALAKSPADSGEAACAAAAVVAHRTPRPLDTPLRPSTARPQAHPPLQPHLPNPSLLPAATLAAMSDPLCPVYAPFFVSRRLPRSLGRLAAPPSCRQPSAPTPRFLARSRPSAYSR